MKWTAIWLMLLALMVPSAAWSADDDKPALAGVGGAAGIGQYPPSAWGVAATTIRNPSAAEQQLLVTFNFDDTPTLQFAADVWMPPKTRRSIWLPIRTNHFEMEEYRAVSLALRQQLYDRRGGQPVLLGEANGMITAARDRWITGMLADPDEADDEQISVALALRRAVEYSQRMAYLNERALPTMPAGWQGLNGLVIAKSRLELDSAQTQALRQWLLSGGKLWVMVDQVDPLEMAQLLGETWTLETVDRVPLSTVAIQSAQGKVRIDHVISVDDTLSTFLDGKPAGTLAGNEAARKHGLDALKNRLEKLANHEDRSDPLALELRFTGAVTGEVVTDVVDAVRSTGAVDALVRREHERPVEMVRVLARDFEVMHTIDGWPVSLRKPVGKGALLLTTLGSRGWMEPRLVPQQNLDGTESKDGKGRRMMMLGHIATRPLRDLSDWFHQDRREATLPPAAFDEYVGEQIGYTIVSRGTVMWLLAFFTFSLLAAGVWLARGGRLEHLAWVGAAMSVVMTLLLVVVGQANRSSVPMTVAVAQFVQVASDQQQAGSSGLITIYNNGEGGSEATLGAQAGGYILPTELSENLTRQVRMVWTDFDRWHWENIGLLSGANTRATFEHVTPLKSPVDAKVTFDVGGALLRVRTGDLGRFSELIIATPHGVLATRSEGDAYRSGKAEQLPAGQFIASGVIDDTQRRRQDVLRRLMGVEPAAASRGGAPSVSAPVRQRSVPFPDRPVVLAWSDALPLGFDLPQASQRMGSALVSVPITIERPATGTKVAIPSPFISYRVVRGRYGPTTPVYVEDQRKWNSAGNAGTVALSFQLPPELLPLTPQSGRFRLDISAPDRAVEVLTDRDGQLNLLTMKQSFDGVLEVDVPAEDLRPDEKGRVMVIFRIRQVGPPNQSLWFVRSVGLEIDGVISGP